MSKLRKFKWGTDGFKSKGKLVRTRPAQVHMHRVHSGTAVMQRGEAANRLKVYRKTYGKKKALQIKRESSKLTKHGSTAYTAK